MFPVVAARAWNSLPSSVRAVQSLATFRQQKAAKVIVGLAMHHRLNGSGITTYGLKANEREMSNPVCTVIRECGTVNLFTFIITTTTTRENNNSDKY